MTPRTPLLLVLASLAAGAARLHAADDQRLIEAARRQDARAVGALIRQGVDVNGAQADGATALHWAAQWDDAPTAGLLLKAGARPGTANDYGVTPLWYACLNGSVSMIEALLKAGAAPGAALPTGETALMTAARTGKTAAVDVLLRAGADPNARESVKGQTALMWAVAEGHAPVVRQLLDAGARVNAASAGGFTPLMFAARRGDIGIARTLLERGADLAAESEEGHAPLLVAVVRGQVDFVLFLLERGADPNASNSGYTALHWASGRFESSHTHDYSEVKDDEWRSLAEVPRDRKVELIKALLARGADLHARITLPPPRYGFVLFKAKYVLGATPFFLATTVADLDVMRVLLGAGARPLVTTDDQTTTLQVAAGMARVDTESLVPEARHLEAVKLLMDLGSDVNAANSAGNTALHAAAMAGFDTVAQFLVDRGARLDAKNKNGETPLRLADGYIADTMLYVRSGTAKLLRTLGASAD